MTELHVVADERNAWRVYEDGATAPLSEHTNAPDAERAAVTRGDERHAHRVVVYDRYHCPHDADLSQSAGPRAARQLTLVRERARRLASPRTR
jgi:hypothetical protein